MNSRGYARVRRFAIKRRFSLLVKFMESESFGGILLMSVAALAVLAANSPWSQAYLSILAYKLGPLSVLHWINDGLMVLFFVLVGLEIKHELICGALSTAKQRLLPGVGALGGMVVPALVYIFFNSKDQAILKGWAIPTATDIAFALGVLSLVGSRVPESLKVFLTALAIIDDLGAVIIIAIFYGGKLELLYLGASAVVFFLMLALNKLKVRALAPFLILGLALWIAVMCSGVHATIAGVLTAFTIPLDNGSDSREESPLHRLEGYLHKLVPYFVLPLFGFANAGLSGEHVQLSALTDGLTLGVGLGLVLGKPLGVIGTCWLLIRMGAAQLPKEATWPQFAGLGCLCGIGFTMSLFVSGLAFATAPLLQEEAKMGIMLGSLASACLGLAILWVATKQNEEAIG